MVVVKAKRRPKPRTTRRDDQDRALGVLSLQIAGLDRELRAALARKPNQALVDLVGQSKALVYQLKGLRTELDGVQDQLRKNTDAVSRLLGLAPTLATTVGAPMEAITDAEIDRRIREGVQVLVEEGVLEPGAPRL